MTLWPCDPVTVHTELLTRVWQETSPTLNVSFVSGVKVLHPVCWHANKQINSNVSILLLITLNYWRIFTRSSSWGLEECDLGLDGLLLYVHEQSNVGTRHIPVGGITVSFHFLLKSTEAFINNGCEEKHHDRTPNTPSVWLLTYTITIKHNQTWKLYICIDIL